MPPARAEARLAAALHDMATRQQPGGSPSTSSMWQRLATSTRDVAASATNSAHGSASNSLSASLLPGLRSPRGAPGSGRAPQSMPNQRELQAAVSALQGASPDAAHSGAPHPANREDTGSKHAGESTQSAADLQSRGVRYAAQYGRAPKALVADAGAARHSSIIAPRLAKPQVQALWSTQSEPPHFVQQPLHSAR